jgi:hypothetical protein
MIKKSLIPVLVILLSMHLAGCTSSDASKENPDSAVASDDSFPEEGSGDLKGSSTDAAATDQPATDAAPVDAAAPDAAAAGADVAAGDKPAGAGDDLSLDEGNPDKEFPEDVAANPPAQGDAKAPTDNPTDEKLFAQSNPGDAPPPAATENAAPAPDAQAAPTDSAAPSTDIAAVPVPTDSDTSAAPAEPKKFLPLEKIKDATFEKNGVIMNRVYLARPGDTTKSVSQKIYGSNRSKDLKAWNPILKNRAMKTGDKVYYNSPRDPADSSKMMVYYDEIGVPPQTYTTKDGDNIRKISKQLLGSSESWKEVWATNAVESKGDVAAGTDLRYWPKDADAAAVNVADNGTHQPKDIAGAAGPTAGPSNGPGNGLPAKGDMPALPPDDPVANSPDLATPPAGAAAQVGANNPAPPDLNQPPPPPPQQAAPPPPPPVASMPPAPPAKPKMNAPIDASSSDPDTTMILAAAGVVLLGVAAAFVVVRKNRAKRIDLSQTQV